MVSSLITEDPVLRALFVKDKLKRAVFLLYLPTMFVFFCSVVEGTLFSIQGTGGLGIFKHAGNLLMLILNPIIIISYVIIIGKLHSFLKDFPTIMDSKSVQKYDVKHNSSLKKQIDSILENGFQVYKHQRFIRYSLIIAGIVCSGNNAWNCLKPVEVYFHDVFDSIHHLAFDSCRPKLTL